MPKTLMTETNHSVNGMSRSMVTALHSERCGTAVRARGSAGSTVLALEAKPDLDGARRRLRAPGRIDRVELTIDQSGISAHVHGKRNRLPYVGSVSIPVALGLTELGVRTMIVDGGS